MANNYEGLELMEGDNGLPGGTLATPAATAPAAMQERQGRRGQETSGRENSSGGQQPLRRSTRQTRIPVRFDDYILYKGSLVRKR